MYRALFVLLNLQWMASGEHQKVENVNENLELLKMKQLTLTTDYLPEQIRSSERVDAVDEVLDLNTSRTIQEEAESDRADAFREAKLAGMETKRRSGRSIDEGSSCRDMESEYRCRFLQQYSACHTHKQRMRKICSWTCGFCGTKVWTGPIHKSWKACQLLRAFTTQRVDHCKAACDRYPTCNVAIQEQISCRIMRCGTISGIEAAGEDSKDGYYKVVNENAKTCKNTRYGCCRDGSTAAEGQEYYGCDDFCRDMYGKSVCRRIKQLGFCTELTSSITLNCMHTCGLCRKCRDRKPRKCLLRLKYNLCGRNQLVDTMDCRASCHRCGRNDPCYMFPCKNGLKCDTDVNGHPFCSCRVQCSPGDHYTGSVCGRNNVQYKSLCHLRQAQCKTRAKITVKNYGPCARITKRNSVEGNVGILPCIEAKHGCCLDEITSAADASAGNCPRRPRCRDASKIFCRKFIPACGLRGNQLRMRHFCPNTCNYCAL